MFTALILLSACEISVSSQSGSKAQDNGKHARAPMSNATAPDDRFTDVAEKTRAAPAAGSILHVQVVLDRLGFSSGVNDGREGRFYGTALRGFQDASGIDQTGKLDDATRKALAKWDDLPVTKLVHIPSDFSRGPFFKNLPTDPAEQAKLPALGYRDLMEKLSERFHTTPETLASLNPRKADDPSRPDGIIRVPNIDEGKAWTPQPDDRGWGSTLKILAVSADQPPADHIVVDKSESVLKVFDAANTLIAQFPATMGSSHDPLPLGKWTIKGVSRNPTFHYNPKLFWDAAAGEEKQKLMPGPNSPVGVVWTDISKSHYGIHGTAEPSRIGRSESHGCIRLTNWDAARLAQEVKPGVPAVFQE
jgi:lipoprotein-anchoring transpeptidase ErfK/SrfK